MKHYWSASKPINVSIEAFTDVQGLKMEPSVDRKHNVKLSQRGGKSFLVEPYFCFYRLNTLVTFCTLPFTYEQSSSKSQFYTNSSTSEKVCEPF